MILTCPLKTFVVELHNLISMNIFFIIKDHSFLYNCKDTGEYKQITKVKE